MIRARYENGVFKPLEDVKLAEGTLVKISVPVVASPKGPRSVRDWPAFGIWADRDDIPDGFSYEDALRNRRREAKLRIEMAHRTDKAETGGDQVRLPAGVMLKPPVSLDELKTDTEYDPVGAEEFVALIRALRNEGSRPVAL